VDLDVRPVFDTYIAMTCMYLVELPGIEPCLTKQNAGLRVDLLCLVPIHARSMIRGAQRMFGNCRLPGERDHFRAGFAMSMGPPVCH
jgi:hypothetical protein